MKSGKENVEERSKELKDLSDGELDQVAGGIAICPGDWKPQRLCNRCIPQSASITSPCDMKF